MGAVIPFVARVRDQGDWTAAERAKLEALAEQFAAQGVTVEVVYGATDAGDPWCVVKDDNEEVLLHVARIGGRFVVHYAADDSLTDAADLPSALGERLMAYEPADVVVPFAAGRSAQVLLALVAATAFFYETREAHAEAAPPTHDDPPPDHAPVVVAALAEEGAHRAARVDETHAAATADPAPGAHATGSLTHVEAAPVKAAEIAAAAEPAPPAEAPSQPVASHAAAPEAPAHDDRPAAAEAAATIHGGAGADTLAAHAAGHGQYEVLDGGAGDDVIAVAPQVVAIGGAGADTFVVEAPKAMSHAELFLGFIADFRAGDGDRIVTHTGHRVDFVGGPETAARTHPPEPPPDSMTGETYTQFVDLNGDGRPDGFLVIGHGPPPDQPKDDPPAEPHDPGVAAGQGFVHELFG
jgi:hypothetical protein